MRTWTFEDGEFRCFAQTAGNDSCLYGADNNKVWKLDQDEGYDDYVAVASTITSKPFVDVAASQLKILDTLYINYELPYGSVMSIYLSGQKSGNGFVKIAELPNTVAGMVQKILVPINIINDCNWYRFKIIAYGPFVLHNIEKKLRMRGS